MIVVAQRLQVRQRRAGEEVSPGRRRCRTGCAPRRRRSGRTSPGASRSSRRSRIAAAPGRGAGSRRSAPRSGSGTRPRCCTGRPTRTTPWKSPWKRHALPARALADGAVADGQRDDVALAGAVGVAAAADVALVRARCASRSRGAWRGPGSRRSVRRFCSRDESVPGAAQGGAAAGQAAVGRARTGGGVEGAHDAVGLGSRRPSRSPLPERGGSKKGGFFRA